MASVKSFWLCMRRRLADAQLQQLLRDAIELLQPLDKAVLVLSDFEDLSNEDMPAALQDRLLSFLQTRLTRVPQACQGGRDQG
jgi:DNA-directed RNA polymerase specialized sigma24 family protein